MRHVTFALVSSAALLIAGCNNAPQANVQGNLGTETLYKMIAGPVTGDRTAGINGTFRVTEAADGIPSDLLGGACIIFRAGDLDYSAMPKTCNNNSQCKAPGAAGYCSPDHTCWGRPLVPPQTDPLCRRSNETQHWQPGVDNPIGAAGPIPVPAGLKPNAQAVVVACLRGKGDPGASDADPASTLCGRPKSMFVWGQPTTIP